MNSQSGNAGEEMSPCRAFISYAADSDAHVEAVRGLWEFLRSCGIDAKVDLSAADERRDWPLWVAEQVRAADHILMIASTTYRKCADGLSEPAAGQRVQWETRLIREAFYRDQHALNRFLPVILPGETANGLPDFLAGASSTVYPVREFTVAGADPLLRLLTKQPACAEPPLGDTPALGRLQRPMPPAHDGGGGVASVSIEDAACDFDAVGTAVLDSRFTGRKWMIARVDDVLRRQRCGYVWVEAPAGLGKSALAVHLVQTRGWVWHFARVSRGGTTRVGLQNLAAQLITRYDLWDWAPGRMLTPRVATPEGFERLLGQAAGRARSTGRRLVIVVDGADESDPVDGLGPWGLPIELPVGVYVIGTSRTGFRVPAGATVLRIEPLDARNQEDLAVHLDIVLREPDFGECLARADITPERLVVDLAERCGGVWVFMRYLLEEIRCGLRDPRRLTDLPADLSAYYLATLERWSTDPRWFDGILPLLATLAVAGQPLPTTALADLSGVDASAVRSWCHLLLRPFLTARPGTPDGRRFAIYHASLRDLLIGTSPHGETADRVWMWSEQLHAAAIAAHRRIAQHYLAIFGGLEAGLPLLAADPTLATCDDRYPLRHLAHHLLRGGQADQLHRLLRAEHAENVWFVAHDSAETIDDYLADLALAQMECQQRTDRALADGQPAPSLAEELRYWLMTGSIISLSTVMPTDLLVELLVDGQWTPNRAIAHARRQPDAGRRAEALTLLVPHLSTERRPLVVQEALTAALASRYPSQRAELLADLVPYLTGADLRQASIEALTAMRHASLIELGTIVPKLTPYLTHDLVARALSVAVNMDDKYLSALALVELAPALDTGQLRSTVSVALGFQDEQTRVRALTGLAPYLTDEQRASVISTALAAALTIPNGSSRVRALVELAPHLAGGPLRQALSAAIAAAVTAEPHDRAQAVAELMPYLTSSPAWRADHAGAEIPDDRFRARAFARLTPYLNEWQCRSLLPIASDFTSGHDRVRALAGLAPYLTGEERESALTEAFATATGVIGQGAVRTASEAALGPDGLDKALIVAGEIEDDDELVRVVADLATRWTPTAVAATQPEWASYLDEEQPDDELTDELTTALTIGDVSHWADALTDLAPYLTGDQLSQALAATLSIAGKDYYGRARALARLVPYLDGQHRRTAVAQTLADAMAMSDDEEYISAYLLSELVPYLDGEQRVSAVTATLTAVGNSISGSPYTELLTTVMPYADDEQRIFTANAILATVADRIFESGHAELLAAMVPYLAGDHLPRALSAALAMTQESARAKVLADLSPRLTHDHLRQALTEALAASDVGVRARSLTGLVPYLADGQRESAMSAALSATLAVSDRFKQRETMAELVPFLTTGQIQQALSAARAISDRYDQAQAMITLAPRLTTDQLGYVLTLIQAIPAGRNRSCALAGLVPYLTGDQIQAALIAAQRISDTNDRVDALIQIAPYLTSQQQAAVQAEALSAVLAYPHESARAAHLATLARRLTGEQIQRALDVVAVFARDSSRSWALTELAPYLTTEQVGQALAAALAITWNNERLLALNSLTSRLTEDQLMSAADFFQHSHFGTRLILLERAAELFGDGATYLSLMRATSTGLDRQQVLSLMRICMTTLRHMAGQDFGRPALDALCDVRRWWP